MKIIGVNLSSHMNSTSAKIVSELLRGAEAAGHETQIFDLARGNLKGCTGCHACKLEKATGCVQRDDMVPYFEALYDADIVVIGAACYMGSPNGHAWNFMNRHFSLNKELHTNCRVPVGKKLISVFTQGVPDPNHYTARYDAYLEPFTEWCFVLGDRLVATSENTEAVTTEAYKLGSSL